VDAATRRPDRRRRPRGLGFTQLLPLTLLFGALALKAVEPGSLESLRLAVFDSYQRCSAHPRPMPTTGLRACMRSTRAASPPSPPTRRRTAGTA